MLWGQISDAAPSNGWAQVLFAVLTPIGLAVLGLLGRVLLQIGKLIERVEGLLRWRERTERRLDVIETASIDGPIRGRQVREQIREELANGDEPEE